MAEAIFAILIGAVIAFYPKESLQIFLIMIGIWAAIMGLLQIIVAVQMKEESQQSQYVHPERGDHAGLWPVIVFNPMGAIKPYSWLSDYWPGAGLLLVYLGFKVRDYEGVSISYVLAFCIVHSAWDIITLSNSA